MPLVTTDDGRFCFLIDTGASFNVMLQDAFQRHSGLFTRLGRNDWLIGMNGEPQDIFLIKGSISLGGQQFQAEFGVMEQSEALRTVRVLTGKHIDGALGVDFFIRYNLILDFHTLEIHD